MSLYVNSSASPYLILVSSSGHRFYVPRSLVMCSGFIRNLLNSPSQWQETTDKVPTIQLNNIDTHVLEKIIRYCVYKQRWEGQTQRPKFEIELHEVIKVLLAANFLDM